MGYPYYYPYQQYPQSQQQQRNNKNNKKHRSARKAAGAGIFAAGALGGTGIAVAGLLGGLAAAALGGPIGAIGAGMLASGIFGAGAVAGGKAVGHAVANGGRRQNNKNNRHNHNQQPMHQPYAPVYISPQQRFPAPHRQIQPIQTPINIRPRPQMVQRQNKWFDMSAQREMERQERKRREEEQLRGWCGRIAQLLKLAGIHYLEVRVKKFKAYIILSVEERLPDSDRAIAEWIESELSDYDGRVTLIRVHVCQECGAVSPKYAKFCDQCGKKLIADKFDVPTEGKNEEPKVEQKKTKKVVENEAIQMDDLSLSEEDLQPATEKLREDCMKNIEGGDELDEEDFQPTPKEYIKQGGIIMLNEPSDETIEEEDLQPELTDEQVREIMEKIQGKPVERSDKVETVVKKAMAKKRKGRQRTAVVWKKRVKPEEDKPKDVTKATLPRIKEGDRAKVVDGPLKGCECEVRQVRGDRAEVIELNSGMSITLPVSYLST